MLERRRFSSCTDLVQIQCSVTTQRSVPHIDWEKSLLPVVWIDFNALIWFFFFLNLKLNSQSVSTPGISVVASAIAYFHVSLLTGEDSLLEMQMR